MTICLFTIFSSSRKKQIVSNTSHNRMPERRENCKKQIVSNTNHNRMPERRENCKIRKIVLQFSLLSGILLLLVL
jgi:hypothetical protein